MTAQPSPQQLMAMNDQARAILIDRSVDSWQPTATQALSGTIPGQVVNFQLRNIGLLKRIIIEITGTFVRSAAETHTLQAWGPANILSNVTLTDYNSQNRIQTSGWHLFLAATARRQLVWGGALTNDSPVDIGNNMDVIKCPASVTTVQPFRMYYEVPVAYGDFDLRGAMFMNVINANAQLQMTVNPNFSVSSTGNGVLAVYKSSSTDIGTVASMTIRIHQNYLDQIPKDRNNNPILPVMDLSKMYQLQNTALTGLSANQDFPVPYANGRSYLSTAIIYDDAGTLTAGTNVNYLAMTAANNLNFINTNPWVNALLTRQIISDDFPNATYYIDHRKQPINTLNYGNIQTTFNPASVAGATSQLLVGWEFFSDINQIVAASSLPAG